MQTFTLELNNMVGDVLIGNLKCFPLLCIMVYHLYLCVLKSNMSYLLYNFSIWYESTFIILKCLKNLKLAWAIEIKLAWATEIKFVHVFFFNNYQFYLFVLFFT